MSPRKLNISETDKEVAINSAKFVIEIANSAIKERAKFTIGVSGGSLSKFLCAELPKLETDWSKWHIFFCDERHVDFNDAECTYTYYKENLLSKVPISADHIYPDEPAISVEEAADRYESKIRQVVEERNGLPRFDLLVLGMGPDGHTCSLFPGHKLLQETGRWVCSISDSPKPPPQRITLTLPVLNAARNAAFISCGAGKADMIKRVLEGDESLPASLVLPTDGTVHWFMDKPAARLLSSPNL